MKVSPRVIRRAKKKIMMKASFLFLNFKPKESRDFEGVSCVPNAMRAKSL